MQNLIEKVNQCLGEGELPEGNGAEHFIKYFLVPNFVNSGKLVLQHNHLPEIYKHLTQKDKNVVLAILMSNKRLGTLKLPKPLLYGIILSNINLIDFTIEKLDQLSQKELQHIVGEEFKNITFSANNFDKTEAYSDVKFNHNIKNKYGHTPLYCAILNDHTEAVKFLLDNKADVYIKNNKGSTPLHLASYIDQTESVKLLLENKAKVDIQDKDGHTPLHLAALNGKTKSAVLLIRFGADYFGIKNLDKLKDQKISNLIHTFCFNNLKIKCDISFDQWNKVKFNYVIKESWFKLLDDVAQQSFLTVLHCFRDFAKNIKQNLPKPIQYIILKDVFLSNITLINDLFIKCEKDQNKLVNALKFVAPEQKIELLGK